MFSSNLKMDGISLAPEDRLLQSAKLEDENLTEDTMSVITVKLVSSVTAVLLKPVHSSPQV